MQMPADGFCRTAYELRKAGHRMVGRSRTGETRYRLTDQQKERAERRFAGLIELLGCQRGAERDALGAPRRREPCHRDHGIRARSSVPE